MSNSAINYTKSKMQKQDERFKAMQKRNNIPKDNEPIVDIFKWGSTFWGHDHFKYFTVILPLPMTEEDIMTIVKEGWKKVNESN